MQVLQIYLHEFAKLLLETKYSKDEVFAGFTKCKIFLIKNTIPAKQ